MYVRILAVIAFLLPVASYGQGIGQPIGRAPICTRAQVQAATCQLIAEGYRFTYTEGHTTDFPNRCAATTAGGTQDVRCVYRGSEWVEWEESSPVPWTSPLADEKTMAKLQHLKRIEGISADSFQNHYYFSSYTGSDANSCTKDSPCRSLAWAKYICTSHSRCTFESGEHWSPYVLTVDALDEFIPGEAIDWNGGSDTGRVLDWRRDPEGIADSCAAAPCAWLVVYMDNPTGHAAPGTPPAVSDVIIPVDNRHAGVTVDAAVDTLKGVWDVGTYASPATVDSTVGNTTITDAAPGWTDDEHNGKLAYMTSGPAIGLWRVIVATNDSANTLTVSPNFVGTPQVGNTYHVTRGGRAQDVIDPDCTDDPDGPCILYESSSASDYAYFDCGWDDPLDPHGNAMFMVEDDENPDDTEGWVVGQGLSFSRCYLDIFSTSTANIAGSGKMLLVNTAATKVVNVDADHDSRNSITTHANGWIVALNTDIHTYQDSSGGTGAPVAITGAGGAVIIGHSPIVAEGSALTFRAQSNDLMVPIVGTGGDMFIYGHPIRGGGSSYSAGYYRPTYLDANSIGVPVAGDDPGVSFTLVRSKNLEWVEGSPDIVRFTEIADIGSGEYLRYKLYSVTIGGVNTASATPGRCFQIPDKFTAPLDISFYFRGVVMDECEVYWRDNVGEALMDLYTVDIQQSAYDDDDAIQVNFCQWNIDVHNSVEDCQADPVVPDDWHFFDDVESINIGENGTDKTVWRDDTGFFRLPAHNIHPDSNVHNISIGQHTIMLPQPVNGSGYIPAWVLGTSENITGMSLQLKMGGN